MLPTLEICLSFSTKQDFFANLFNVETLILKLKTDLNDAGSDLKTNNDYVINFNGEK